VRILILHYLPESYVDYTTHLDHGRHDVTYVSTPDRTATLPANVRARRIELAAGGDGAANVLAAVSESPRPDLVIALAEFDQVPAARIREALGVPGATVQDALLVRDKVRMKAAVAAAGLRVPRFAVLTEALAADARSVAWSGRTVLKPRAGASSVDTYTFSSVPETLAAARTGVIEADLDEFEIEEFIEGRVLHIDGLIEQGGLIAIQASRYVGDCLAYARGKPLGSVQFDTDPALVEWSLSCLKAVGITHGAFHLEAIEGAEGLVFLEVGARCGSVGVIDAFRLATGVHQPGTALQLLVDGTARRRQVLSPGTHDRYGWFAFPGHTLGSPYCRISNERAFRDDPLVRLWNQRDVNEPLSPTVTYSYAKVPVSGLIGPGSTEDLERFLTRLFATVRVDPLQHQGG
jgi:hypothetical protein